MAPDLEKELLRVVGDLRCIDVLEHLPDYLDGSLGAAERVGVDEHLAGCDNCARFGAVYLRAVGTMRTLSGGAAHEAGSATPGSRGPSA